MGLGWGAVGGLLGGAPSWCSQHFNSLLIFTVTLPPATGRVTLYADDWLQVMRWVFLFFPLFFPLCTCHKMPHMLSRLFSGGEVHLDINNAPVKVCVCVCVQHSQGHITQKSFCWSRSPAEVSSLTSNTTEGFDLQRRIGQKGREEDNVVVFY